MHFVILDKALEPSIQVGHYEDQTNTSESGTYSSWVDHPEWRCQRSCVSIALPSDGNKTTLLFIHTH